MTRYHWTDGEEAEGVYVDGRLTIFATPSMTADDGTVAVGVDVPEWLEALLSEEPWKAA